MPVRRNLHLLKAVRDNPIEFDSQTPAVCPDAEEFAEWTQHLLAEVLTEPKHETLDSALLQLTKEYLHRKSRINHPHLGYICFPQVFENAAEKLFEKQMSLIRENGIPRASASAEKQEVEEMEEQVLYIGEEIEEN